MGFFLLLKEKVVCVHNRVNPLTLTPTIKADLVHFNARSAAFCSNIMNVHHFSSLCSVSWLLMSGYLSYPRENPSLSLFRELSNPSVIEETGEHSRVFQAFKVSCLKTLSLYLLFKLTSICHNLIACVSSRLRKEIYGVITLCLKGSYLCDPPHHRLCLYRIWCHTSRNGETSVKIHTKHHKGFSLCFCFCGITRSVLSVEWMMVGVGGHCHFCAIIFFNPEVLSHCKCWTWLSALTLSGKTKHTGKSGHLISVVVPLFFFGQQWHFSWSSGVFVMSRLF